jgi:hypothetical protein
LNKRNYDLHHDQTLPDLPAAINQAEADGYGALRMRQAYLARIAARCKSTTVKAVLVFRATFLHFSGKRAQEEVRRQIKAA